MASEFADVRLDRGRPLRAQVYALLRERIVRGAIAPGALIDEKRIAGELGISRTPVREAVKRLDDEQLVVVVAQSSTRAAPLDLRQLEEDYLIRRALECESAAQAAPRTTAAHARDLRGLIRRQGDCIDAGRYAEAIGVDDAFHHRIAEIGRVPRLWHVIEISKAQIDRCRHLMLPRLGEGATTLRHHRNIVRALAGGDATRAQAAMRAHLDAAWRSTAALLRAPGSDPGSDHPWSDPPPEEDRATARVGPPVVRPSAGKRSTTGKGRSGS